MNAKENCPCSGGLGKVPRSGGLRRTCPSRRAFLRAALAAALLAPLAGVRRALALRICGRCGHEAFDDAQICGHCGADLPLPAPEISLPASEPDPAPESDDPFAAAAAAAATLAAEHVQRAVALAEREAWVGALLFARNASALHALAHPGDTARTADLARQIQQARARMEAVTVECPMCDGTGLRRTRTVTLQGESIEQDVAGSACGLCRGARGLPGRRSAGDIQRLFVEGERALAAELRGQGLETRFGVWLPAGSEAVIPPLRLAAMLRALDVWCTACHGIGHTGCARCRGAGALRCTNRNCLHGVETCPTCGGRGRSDGRRCTDCIGSGRRDCATCEGRGFIACGDCEGRGDRTCAACRGTGYPATCNRCEGEGTVVCTRCRGTGSMRGETCSYCRGDRVILCSACGGYGRRRR